PAQSRAQHSSLRQERNARSSLQRSSYIDTMRETTCNSRDRHRNSGDRHRNSGDRHRNSGDRHQILKYKNSVSVPRITLLCFCAFVVSLASAQAPTYDLILRNGRIVDGSGSAWYRSDVAIRGDTIARIAPSITESAARIIDVGG